MEAKKTWWLRLGAGVYDSWKLQGDVEELWDELAKLGLGLRCCLVLMVSRLNLVPKEVMWRGDFVLLRDEVAEKVHQEKVQQEKLKALKACLNFEETSRHFESRTLNRRRDLKERLGPRHARSMSGSLESRRSRSRKRVCPHTQEVQGIGHTTEILKAATKVLAPEKQSLPPRNIITKEHPREERKHYLKVKVAQEGEPGSAMRTLEVNTKEAKVQALRMTSSQPWVLSRMIGMRRRLTRMHDKSSDLCTKELQSRADQTDIPKKSPNSVEDNDEGTPLLPQRRGLRAFLIVKKKLLEDFLLFYIFI
ncbi:hypothetical protein Tco_1402064 [Tanacetum coccineum]